MKGKIIRSTGREVVRKRARRKKHKVFFFPLSLSLSQSCCLVKMLREVNDIRIEPILFIYFILWNRLNLFFFSRTEREKNPAAAASAAAWR